MTSRTAPAALATWSGPALITAWATAVGLAPGTEMKLVLLLPPLFFGAVWYLAARPEQWLLAFFAVALLTPPLPFGAGNSGAHLAPAVALVGLFAGTLHLGRWRPCPP